MKRKFFYPLALLSVLLLTLGFTSCNSDDDPTETEVVYSIAVTSDYDGVPTEAYMNEVKSVQDAYDEYFSANANHKFSTMTIDIDSTNARIATLASVVNTALQVRTWHYNINVQITNDNSGAVVYRANYKP